MLDSPPVPELPGALCRKHPNPDLWFSTMPTEREAARHICRSCPALAACREWALSQPLYAEIGIVAAMSAAERKREQRQRAGQDAPRPRNDPAEVRASVLAVVTGQPGLSVSAIERQVPHRTAHVRRALAELEAAGQIRRISAGQGFKRLHYPAELRQLSAGAARNKAKTSCGVCGEPLSGANLMVIRDSDGGRERRDCRNCQRRRTRNAHRLRRMLASRAAQAGAALAW